MTMSLALTPNRVRSLCRLRSGRPKRLTNLAGTEFSGVKASIYTKSTSKIGDSNDRYCPPSTGRTDGMLKGLLIYVCMIYIILCKTSLFNLNRVTLFNRYVSSAELCRI